MNPEVVMTLDDCVEEVLGMLTGMELQYQPEQDRYRAVTRQLNRALRANATEREWAFYASIEEVGVVHAGDQDVHLRATVRPRIIGDDAVRLVDETGRPRVWAYFLPRDAVEKYVGRQGLWVSITKQALHFSRPFMTHEQGLRIQLPVMREPKQFRLPPSATDPSLPESIVPAAVRDQPLDFDYPDLVIARAAYFYAMTDPMMQPRAQTLEEEYKNLFYALNERDDRNTDHPFLNEYRLPMESNLMGDVSWAGHGHPHADERGY